jgi:hypothetical protein
LANGTGTWLKSTASADGTVGGNVVTLGDTVPKTQVTMVPGDGGYFESDGSAWFILAANRSFTANNIAPVITSLKVTGSTDDEGPISGGTSITITGAYFTGATAVVLVSDVDGTIAPTIFTVTSDTSIVAVTSAVSVTVRTKYLVRVTTTETTTTTSGSGVVFYYDPVPTVTGVSPAKTGAGQTLTIVGTNFIVGETDTVTFTYTGGAPLPVTNGTASSSTSMTVPVPLLTGIAQGAIVSVTVTTQGGTSTADAASRFEYYLAPTVDSLVGPLGGPITITGTNFVAPMKAFFGGVEFNTVVTSASSATVTVNNHAAGTVTLAVETFDGTSVNSTYTYTNSSVSVWPTTGAVNDTVTFTGEYFVVGSIDVYIGGTSATVLPGATSTSFSVTVPSGTNAQQILVTSAGASITSPGPFYYLPTVNSLVGPLGGPVTLTGTNFIAPMTATFGGVVYNAVVASATSATVTLANHAAGEVSLTVTTPGGTSAISTYTYTDPIVTVWPASGNVGDTVTFTGEYFVVGNIAVTIAGNPAPVLSGATATSFSVTVPFGPTAQSMTVTTGGVSLTSLGLFYYQPTVDNLSGPAGGGTVTLIGQYFVEPMTVTFNGVPFSATVINLAQATVVAPAGASNVPLIVIVGTNIQSNAATYTFIPAPTINSVSPATGPTAGGTAITINGANFSYADSVTIGGVAVDWGIDFAGQNIFATTPVGTSGAASVVVTTPYGANPANSLFTYVPPPSVSSVAPATGSTSGGTSITINGTNFTGATGVTVGGVAATGLIVVSSTQIKATTPTGTLGTASVVVTTPYGANDANALFTYTSAPILRSIDPAFGIPAGGNSVTLVGENFIVGTTVLFGAISATITASSPTSMTVTAPEGSGPVGVFARSTNGDSNAITYTYTQVPT